MASMASFDRGHWQGWARANSKALDRAAPEGWPASYRHPRAVDPLCHGDHAAGLAPFYAVTNAVRLLDEDVTDRDTQFLLRSGWAWVDARQAMRPDRTLRAGQWHRLIGAMIFAHSRRTGRTVLMDTPLRDMAAEPHQFDAALERNLVAGRIVLLMLAGANYAVVRGYTPHNLLLTDSGARHWVRRCQDRSAILRPIPATLTVLSLA